MEVSLEHKKQRIIEMIRSAEDVAMINKMLSALSKIQKEQITGYAPNWTLVTLAEFEQDVTSAL